MYHLGHTFHGSRRNSPAFPSTLPSSLEGDGFFLDGGSRAFPSSAALTPYSATIPFWERKAVSPTLHALDTFHGGTRLRKSLLQESPTSSPGGSSTSSSSAEKIARCPSCGHEHFCVRRAPWRRILYERQDYPDWYTDRSFLSSLVTNANVQIPTFWATAKDTLAIIQRLSVIVIHVMLFGSLSQGTLSAAGLLVLDVILMVAASALLLCVVERQAETAMLTEHATLSLRRMMLFAGTLYGLSPVLKTLTKSYSSDTIIALTLMCFTVHLVAHDYGMINSEKRLWAETGTAAGYHGGAISLNAGIFASLLMASRLSSNTEVFAFLLFSYEAYAGFPPLARQIRRYSEDAHIGSAFLLALTALWMLWPFSKLLALLFILSLFFLTLVCPFWLLWVQRYKNEIHGPWDYDDQEELSADNI